MSKRDRKEYFKKYRQDHAEEKKKYNQDHKEEKKQYDKKYRQDHKEKLSEYQKEYRENNKEKVNKNANKYQKTRKQTDPNYKLGKQFSNSIRRMLKKNGSSKNGKSCLDYLPYNIEQLKQHIENQFSLPGNEWMRWSNHGIYNSKTWKDDDQTTWTWQLDHIKPHSSFNYTSMEDKAFKDCWSLDNLRPYSAKQNVIDGDRRSNKSASII
jgi:hypothetical protein